MQNLVFLMDPSPYAERTPIKAGNMCLNRFLIDEDAAFELSGVNYLEKASEYRALYKKGKELSYFNFYTCTICYQKR